MQGGRGVERADGQTPGRRSLIGHRALGIRLFQDGQALFGSCRGSAKRHALAGFENINHQLAAFAVADLFDLQPVLNDGFPPLLYEKIDVGAVWGHLADIEIRNAQLFGPIQKLHDGSTTKAQLVGNACALLVRDPV